MNIHKFQRFLCLLVLVVFASAYSIPVAAAPVRKISVSSDSIGRIIAKYRDEIPWRMQAENIPG